jgi:hypothetical protein
MFLVLMTYKKVDENMKKFSCDYDQVYFIVKIQIRIVSRGEAAVKNMNRYFEK